MVLNFKRTGEIFNTFIALSRLSATEPEEWCANLAPVDDAVRLGVWTHDDAGRRVTFEVLRDDVVQLYGMTSTPARIKAFRKGGADFEIEVRRSMKKNEAWCRRNAARNAAKQPAQSGGEV